MTWSITVQGASVDPSALVRYAASFVMRSLRGLWSNEYPEAVLVSTIQYVPGVRLAKEGNAAHRRGGRTLEGVA
jgi:hypothetical protein